MRETWLPALAMALGMALGPALAAYAGWIVRGRRPERDGRFSPVAVTVAAIANGLGWYAAVLLGKSPVDAANLALMVSAGAVLTLIDVSIRIIPNELAAALFALSAAMALLDQGLAGLPGRVIGFLAALTLLLVAMLIAGGKVGGGDVKLGAAVGFATGFPNVLMAVLLMAALSAVAGGVGILSKRMGKTTPMPFAGFLTAGLTLTLFLDRMGALGFLAW